MIDVASFRDRPIAVMGLGRSGLATAEALLASGAWEDWSTAENLPVSVGAGSANVPLGFEDTWKVGVGLHYRLSDPWLLQAGFSYDTSALRIATARRPSRSTGSSATPSVSNTIGVSSRASVCPSSGSTWATRG